MKIEDDFDEKPKKSGNGSKTSTIIAVLIVVTIIVVIAIIFVIMSMQEKEFSVAVDGKVVSVSEDTFIFRDGKMYISIRDIAPLVGYEAHNGEYKIDVEDMNKMYVEAQNGTETTSFYLNSTTISKVAPNTTNDYENITINEPVTKINDKMYIADDGFTMAFNSLISYSEEQNRATILTLPYLVSGYKTQVTNYGYSGISDDFNNQKAILYGMIVVSSGTNGNYGVISTDGTEIISPRYKSIKFIEASQEFIITNSSAKVGIAYKTGNSKIAVSYDDIKVIDSTLGLYLVKSNNKYGIVDSAESKILYIEYDQIRNRCIKIYYG